MVFTAFCCNQKPDSLSRAIVATVGASIARPPTLSAAGADVVAQAVNVV